MFNKLYVYDVQQKLVNDLKSINLKFLIFSKENKGNFEISKDE